MKNNKQQLHAHQRVEDANGNRGRVLNPNIRTGFARVRMDSNLVREYDVTTIKPLNQK